MVLVLKEFPDHSYLPHATIGGTSERACKIIIIIINGQAKKMNLLLPSRLRTRKQKLRGKDEYYKE